MYLCVWLMHIGIIDRATWAAEVAEEEACRKLGVCGDIEGFGTGGTDEEAGSGPKRSSGIILEGAGDAVPCVAHK